MKEKKPVEKDQFCIQCKIAGLPMPEREYRFHPTRKWRLDYFFPSLQLAVEKEGGVWIRGRHTHPAGFLKDIEKYNELSLAGISLLRFTPKQINDGEAVSKVVLFSSKGGMYNQHKIWS